MIDRSARLKVRKLHPAAELPKRATPFSSGFDIFACIPGEAPIILGNHPQKVGTGIALDIPPGFDVQVRPRSGLSLKGIGVTLGTIDSDYRGEILVTMYIFGDQASYEINHGDRIAQLVIGWLAEVSIEQVETLSETERGTGGHGSTGMR